MPHFTLGVNTISDVWTVPVEKTLPRLAAMGFRQFDVMVGPGHLDVDLTARDCARIRRMLADEGLTIHALTPQNLDHNLASPRAEVRRMTTDFHCRLLDLAWQLGAGGVVLGSGRYNPLNTPPRPQLEGWLRGSLEVLLAHAERAGAKVMLENIPMGVLPDAASMVAWLKDFASPSMSLCYDVANAHFIGEDPAESMALVAPHMELLHLSDTGRAAWRHDPIGTGSIDFAAVSRALASTGYSGLTVVEILSDAPDAAVAGAQALLAPLGWAAPERPAA